MISPAAPAQVLAIVTLLENPFGSGLVRDSVDGNNFVQVGARGPEVNGPVDRTRALAHGDQSSY